MGGGEKTEGKGKRQEVRQEERECKERKTERKETERAPWMILLQRGPKFEVTRLIIVFFVFVCSSLVKNRCGQVQSYFCILQSCSTKHDFVTIKQLSRVLVQSSPWCYQSSLFWREVLLCVLCRRLTLAALSFDTLLRPLDGRRCHLYPVYTMKLARRAGSS